MDEINDNGLLRFQSALQNVVDKSYSYNNQSSVFAALCPTNLKDYAERYVKTCCQWVDGYVPGFHDQNSGIVSTRIASALVTGMAKQIVGEKPIFRSVAQLSKDGIDCDVSKCYKMAKWGNFRQAMFGGVAFAMTTGTSLIKLNATRVGEPWWEAVRLDNAYFLCDFRGRVIDASFYVKNYVDTRPDKGDNGYCLIERRYYEPSKTAKIEDGTFKVLRKVGDPVPMAVYEIHRTRGTALNRVSALGAWDSVPWEELPNFLRKMLRNDYGAIKVGVPMELPFENLGVEVLKDGEMDITVPTAQCFGRSKIADIQSDLINYEIGNAYRLRDAYLGKGSLYLPKSMTMGTLTEAPMGNGGMLSALPDSPVELMKGVDSDSQQAIVKQFELRSAEWQRMMDDALKAIATKWGTTPKALSSYLAQGEAQQTATQIDSEDDMSIAFINQERANFKEPFNRLLHTTLVYKGMGTDVELTFGNPSLINKDRLLARTEKEFEMGLIDIEEAVRQTNPDLDEDALHAKIEKAKARQAEIASQITETSLDGDHDNLTDGADTDELFKDMEEDNGGNNLRGSTNPTQKQGRPHLFE